jgi:PmbA protein
MYVDGEGGVHRQHAGVRGSYRAGPVPRSPTSLAEEDESETRLLVQRRRALEDLDAAAVGREAERPLRLLSAQVPSEGAVILRSASAFFGVLSSALTADAVQKGRSLFAGREGERVAGELLELVDDGTVEDGLDSAPFDGEGVPCGRTPLITGGVLQGFLYDTYTARKAGRQAPATACTAPTRGSLACAHQPLVAGPTRS